MNRQYLLPLLTFVLSLSLYMPSLTLAAEKYNCPAAEIDRLDLVSARILSMSRYQRQFPVTKTALKTFCKETREDVVTLTDLINRCLTGTAKNFAKIVAFSYTNTVKNYCTGSGGAKLTKRGQSLLTISKCVNPLERRLEQCINRYTEKLHGGKRAEPIGNRIAYACCPYYDLLGCVHEITGAECSEEADGLVQELVRNAFQSIIDVACGDFVENSDKCDRLPPAPKKLKSDKSGKTFFLPLVTLWNHL